MAEEETSRSGNGKGESPTNGAFRKPRSAETPSGRARRTSQEPPVNAIQASRRLRKERTRGGEVPANAEKTSTPSPKPSARSSLQRADSDPWTVPESVRDRFVQDGHRFYFPYGAPAFRDLGRRLTTTSENTQLVRSLIEIAHSRGWAEVTVTGTERFKQEAWRQARLEGLAVRGYRPTEEQQAQLVRALARDLTGVRDAVSADPQPVAPAPTQTTREARSADPPGEHLVGKLLDHGKDAYRHDPKEGPSYFVRIQTRDGTREIWGKDIERAVTTSLTQPKVGDEVILQRTGRDLVTVKRPERSADGQWTPREVDVFRNRWVIEKKEFFDQRAASAKVVRNEAVGPREAVRQHPELAGTYLNLRAAELASRSLRDPEDRRRFVAQVRSTLADDIERGEPLQPVRLRERAKPKLVEDPERVR